jgi:peptide/nickel transport system ATP-binding protein
MSEQQSSFDNAQSAEPFVSIRDLTVAFHAGAQIVRAVNGIDLDLKAGEVTSLVGESGSGKSVTLRSILRILPPSKTKISGSVKVGGREVLSMSDRDLRQFRGGTASMIFQEPGLALDPVYRVGDQIVESVVKHNKVGRRAARERALEVFNLVKIPSPEVRLRAYPHEMSGGMLQRVMIALAISCSPKLLLADEPTTALDATVQIQVLLLLREMQQKLGMATIFVTHDVGVAAEISDRVAVMYAGRIVEQGPVGQVLRHPRHPYTKGLLDSTVHGSMRGRRIQAISGAPPDLANLPDGCAFAPRCKHAEPACTANDPPVVGVGDDHLVRCRRSELTLA